MKGQHKYQLVTFLLLACAYSVTGTFCDRSAFEKVGCFKRQDKLFPHLLVNDRDPTHANYSGLSIDWQNYADYLHSLACRCSKVTKSIGYKYFAIGFYGECWAGYNTALYKQVISDLNQGAINCIDGGYWACMNPDINECAGGASTEYVYKLVSDEEEEEW